MDLRASDAERELTVAGLSAHAADGRLDADELEARVEAALSARSTSELARLEADLPPRRGRPGRRSFALTQEVRAYLRVLALLVTIWALTGAGYFWPVWPALGWGIGLVLPGGCRARGRARGRRLTAG